jgi:hypothetical protein
MRLSFLQFLLEYPVSYFEALPAATPPARVEEAAERFGLSDHIKWKWLTNKQFTHSFELETDQPDGIIAMRKCDILENWFHELGHEILDHANKDVVNDVIKPLLDRIRDECRPSHAWLKKQTGRHYKWIELGGYKYTYSHSGKSFEYDELFAITLSYTYMGGKFNNANIQKEYTDMLDRIAADSRS